MRLAEAPSYGQTIIEYAQIRQGAAYRKLAHEVAARLGLSDSIREIDQSASSLEIETVSSGNGI
ncbi:MAG: hypothetical protein R2849_01550 [Thermomicrobiales bacterium]